MLAVTLIFWAVTAQGDEQLPQEVMINGVEFIRIPAGVFYKTGGVVPEGEREVFHRNYFSQPANAKVWLDTYYIGKYEGRARDWARYLNESRKKGAPLSVPPEACSVKTVGDGSYVPVHGDDHPAANFSWNDADRWAKWMGFRLPTEAEWEKAARGNDRRSFPWGDDHPDDTFAGFGSDRDCVTWPVHSFEKGKSPYGVYNMSGNIREYVADWYDADADRNLKDGVRNPQARNGSTNKPRESAHDGPWKLLKGGRWASWPIELRIDYRSFFPPDAAFVCNGARFAVDAVVVSEHLRNGTATIMRR
jgi:iron(II)-dependent oxidoreductase